MALRKELLDRELSKLRFRKADGSRGLAVNDAGKSQQEGQTSHPQADDPGQHGD
jgi:hypothetical protein